MYINIGETSSLVLKVTSALQNKSGTRQRLLVEGRKQFARSGPAGINIDAMCKKVGVSRTSFYHFFDSKAEFLKHLARFWQEDGTLNPLSKTQHIEDPKKRLRTLLEIAFHDQLNNQFHVQLRIAALKNPSLRKTLRETERSRLQALRQFFMDAGQKNKKKKKDSR